MKIVSFIFDFENYREPFSRVVNMDGLWVRCPVQLTYLGVR
jgi:hypothetical protein